MRKLWMLVGMLAVTGLLMLTQVLSASSGGVFLVQVGSGVPAAATAVPLPPVAGQVALGQVVNAEGLSVRSGPFLGASRLDIIGQNTQHPVLARNTAEGIYNWYLIRVRDVTEGALANTETEGWVSGRYFITDRPDSEIPVRGSVFEGLNPGGEGVRGVLRSNMRLRQGPSYRTPTLQILDWGAEVRIIARTLQANDNHWFLVRYNGQLGWLFAPFIAVDGDLNSIPTY